MLLPALLLTFAGLLMFFTRQTLVVDRKARNVRWTSRGFGKGESAVHSFDALGRLKFAKEAGLKTKTATLTLEPAEGRAIFLGCGPLEKAEALAQRLSELTGAPVHRSGPQSPA